jgi:hypothetical protein
MRKLKLVALLFVLVVGLTTALVLGSGALAKIGTTTTPCTNGGGQAPPGQQPTCTGGGLTQTTVATNPAGQQPPGQQP